MNKTSRYNPLAEVDVSTESGLSRTDATVKAMVLDEQSDNSGSYFMERSRTVVAEACKDVCESFPPELRTLGTVYRLLKSQQPETEDEQ